MTQSFPDAFPPNYTYAFIPGATLRVAVTGPDDRRVGTFEDKANSIEASWKHYLNRLGYVGVAYLLGSLSADVTQKESDIVDLRKALDAASSKGHKELEDRIAWENRLNETSKTAIASWKDETADAHKKVKELEAELTAAKAQLKRIESVAVAAKKVSDTLMGCITNPVVPRKVEATSGGTGGGTPKPEPKHPAFDFDGPIPSHMPEGYHIENEGDRKALPYRVHGPNDCSMSCFTEEVARTKAWEHIRDFNKASGKTKPDPKPAVADPKPTEDRTKLPPRFVASYFVSAANSYKLTRPDGQLRYYKSAEERLKAAWAFVDEAAGKPQVQDRTRLPEGFVAIYYTGSAKSDPALPNYKLKRPNGECTYHKTADDRLKAAWRFADEATAKPASTSTQEPKKPPSLPPGYKEAFVGTTSSQPYKLTSPKGVSSYYKTPDALNKAAWEKHREAEAAAAKAPTTTTVMESEPVNQGPPPGYSFVYIHSNPNNWQLNLPHGESMHFLSRRARLVAAWLHRGAPIGEKMAKIKGMETFPASFESEPPDGYEMPPSRTGSDYALKRPDGTMAHFANKTAALKAGWEHYRCRLIKSEDYAGPTATPGTKPPEKPEKLNRKRVPPGYEVTYGSKDKNYGLIIPGTRIIHFYSQSARLAAAWKHYDAKGTPEERERSFRGMEEFPKGWEFRLPDGWSSKNLGLSMTPYRLTGPDGKEETFTSTAHMRSLAWERWRLARNKAADKAAGEPAKSTETVKDTADRTVLPAGFTHSYLGLTSSAPHELTRPDGLKESFTTYGEMIYHAWDYKDKQAAGASKAEAKSEPPKEDRSILPPGYHINFAMSHLKPHTLMSPGGEPLRRFTVRAKAIEAAWKHKDTGSIKAPEEAINFDFDILTI